METSHEAPRQAVGDGGRQGSRSRAAWVATWVILGIHATLLAAALPDYRVSIDSGYHVSLARWYGEHGAAFWDPISFGPGGRPNLQGPALHVAIGLLGRLLGGSGDAYVMANALLALAQWAAAMLTAVYFGRRYGGDWGALFAAALVSGNALAAESFAIGIPSGWIFILAPWAIHFFLEGSLALAALATSLAIYCHLAGYATVPTGILVAALLARRWRPLLIVGAATAALTAPYTIHFLRYRAWYRGEHGHVALALAPLIYLVAVPGLVWLLRHPRKQVFLLAWFAAPAAWLLQDYTRFLAQATLAMSVVGGVWAANARAWLRERFAGRWSAVFSTALVALAILPSPLNFPSLGAEVAWVLGIDYPRALDWREARAVAGAIERAGLAGRLVNAYNPSECSPLAVFTPLRFEKGHWVEVQPLLDPAEDLSAGGKAYVVPLSPRDPVLIDLERRRLLVIHGGSDLTSVVTLLPAAPVASVAPAAPPGGPAAAALPRLAPLVAAILRSEAAWLAANARNNVFAPLEVLQEPAALAGWRRTLREQRTHAGRLEIATLVYAYALEAAAPDVAHRFRGAARGFGSIANFLGDEEAIGFVDAPHHQRLRQNLAAVAAAAARLGPDPASALPLRAALAKLFGEYFTAA
jgi:hypothetical protein